MSDRETARANHNSRAKDLLLTWKDGEIRDIHEDMMSLTLNIVTKTIFDIELSGTDLTIFSRDRLPIRLVSRT